MDLLARYFYLKVSDMYLVVILLIAFKTATLTFTWKQCAPLGFSSLSTVLPTWVGLSGLFWPRPPTWQRVTGDRLRPLQKVSVLHTLPKKVSFFLSSFLWLYWTSFFFLWDFFLREKSTKHVLLLARSICLLSEH